MEEISIEKARARLGDYVNDAQNGSPVLITRSGHPAAMLAPLTRLTADDRWLITAARELAAIPAGAPDADVLRQLGGAKALLGPMADALERLGGHG